ncbi:RHS repeat-associated core domain-containing protein [Coprobacter sp.]
MSKLQGKELITVHGLNWYDSKARMQEFQIPGFKSLDPLCENYYGISPYSYCAGNPVNNVDPTGKIIESVWDITSFVVGAKSFVENVGQGNYKAAVADGLGMMADALAIILPGVPGGAGVAIKAGRTADKATDAVKTVDKINNTNKGTKFNGKTDTYSNTDREAFRKAKDQNGIPRSQQPDKTTTVPEKGTSKNLKQYEFTNSKGEKVQIRKDNPRTYNDGGKQGKHYNAGDKGQKLKQHHKYDQ